MPAPIGLDLAPVDDQNSEIKGVDDKSELFAFLVVTDPFFFYSHETSCAMVAIRLIVGFAVLSIIGLLNGCANTPVGSDATAHNIAVHTCKEEYEKKIAGVEKDFQVAVDGLTKSVEAMGLEKGETMDIQMSSIKTLRNNMDLQKRLLYNELNECLQQIQK